MVFANPMFLTEVALNDAAEGARALRDGRDLLAASLRAG